MVAATLHILYFQLLGLTSLPTMIVIIIFVVLNFKQDLALAQYSHLLWYPFYYQAN